MQTVEKKSRARSPAREIAWSFPRQLIVVGAAAFDAPRTCFPPKTWTQDLDRRLEPVYCRVPLVRTRGTLSDHEWSVTSIWCRSAIDHDGRIEHDCLS